jgi:integrase
MVHTGIRVSEAAGIRVEDLTIYERSGWINIPPQAGSLKRAGCHSMPQSGAPSTPISTPVVTGRRKISFS